MKKYFTYILASENETLYIWVTNNITRRIYEHKVKMLKWFTNKYEINKLVYLEETNNIESALKREKQLKNWKREWKVELINSINPTWKDLYTEE